jgi:hypothetical protein
MTELNLTPEERSLIHTLAHDRAGKGTRLGFYASVLVPDLMFGCYGIAKRDLVALALAFAGSLIFVVWRISREMSLLGAYRSLFAKLADHERYAGK